MPIYKFEAYDADGVQVNSTMVAPSKEAAIDSLQQTGMMVGKIRPALSGKVSSRAINHKVFYQFNQELIALVRAGIPLVEALGMCTSRPGEKNFTNILSEVRKKVLGGQSFSDACQEYPEAFDSIYVAAIRTSEQTGDLREALTHYQSYLERKVKIEKEIKQALYYPVFLVFALGIVLTILFVFVVPKFTELYSGFDMELPLATRIIVSIANAAPLFILISFFIFVASTVVWNLVEKPKAFFLFIDGLLLSIPVLGNTRSMLHQSRLMTMLSGLLLAGTPLVLALKIASESLSGLRLGAAIESVVRDVEDGNRFSASLEKQGVLSEQVIKMLDIGESSGALEQMMKEVAIYSEEMLDERLKQITALFEPTLMLLIGLMVGVVIVAMYMPIFFLAEVVQ